MNKEKDQVAGIFGGAESQVFEVLAGRAAFFDMLAGLYFSPLSQEQIEGIALLDLSGFADVNEDFRSGLHDMQQYLAKRNSGTRQELAVDFTGAFAGTSTFEGKTAVPYKSVFTSENGLLMQEGYEEVFHAYKVQAVRKRSGFDWPEDHLSLMFQFLALMSRRAGEAVAAGDVAQAAADLHASQAFARDQLGSWIGSFVDVANRIVRTRFYRGVLRMTSGYLRFDAVLLQDVIDELEGGECERAR